MQATLGFAGIVRWDCFSYADPLPQYGMSDFPSLWWWDAEKAAKTAKRD